MSKSKKNLIVVGILVVVLLLVFFIFQTNKKPTNTEEDGVKTSFWKEETILYHGNEEAPNDMLFVFDYSCPWCVTWMEEIYPEVEKFIDADELKFRTQSLAYLDMDSFALTKVDQMMKQHYPEKYYDFFTDIVVEEREGEKGKQVNKAYIEAIAAKYDVDVKTLLDDPVIDVTRLSNEYLEGLDLESVPTVIINGEKLADPFDLAEIKAALAD